MSNGSPIISELAVNELVALTFDSTPFRFKHAEPIEDSTVYDYNVTLQCAESGITQTMPIKANELIRYTSKAN